MKIEKLPSGSYRIRKQIHGKKYTVVTQNKPTKHEAEILIAQLLDKGSSDSVEGSQTSFDKYADEFIKQLKEKGKSPATIRGYESINRNIPEEFSKLNYFKITSEMIQDEVDRYAEKHSPKSTSNYYGFIRSVMTYKRPKMSFTIKLPSPEKKTEYEPSTKDIQRILEETKNTEYEIVLQLCALGLRRGEAIAITSADLSDDDVLTIDKDIVIDENNRKVIKETPKTADSYRRILIPHELAEKIRKQGYAYNGYPNSISRYLHTVQDKLGIPRFRLHMMRHFCAAYLHQAGFTDQQIMSYGGWSNSSDVMQRVYRYNLDPEESQKAIASKLSLLS